MPSNADPHIRPIGLLERYHTTRNFLGFDSCVVASGKYATYDRATISRDVLFPALREVIKAHPLLCVKLENETSRNAAFIRLDTIHLPRVVEFLENVTLQAVLEDQLARGFDAEADLPLWRIQVFDNNIVFAIHHAIGDGLSTIAFHASLLMALRNVTADDTSLMVRIPDPVLVGPPIEKLINVQPTFRTLFDEVYKLFAENRMSTRCVWSGNPVPYASSLRTHVRLMTIPAEDVTALCSTCRIHRATLTSAFYILTVAIIARMLNGTHYKAISSAVAISLRDAAGIFSASPTICDFVSAHQTYPHADPNFSWEAAARYAATLRKQKQTARERVGALRFLFNNYVPYLNRLLGAKRTSGFVLSNLGRFNAPAVDGTWNIVSSVFAQCDVVVGAAFKLNVVSDPAGNLNIALTYGEHGIDGAFVESFMSQFMDALYDLIP
ncbi:alcohol acetyltransferase [Mycena alexandri]|uniref:Alcohol acetyltransferase n=1 Tax=Mycena alexandri TaxID=1745969 RepID=A0AAD6S9T1_9AGAR|nr:alcohol acetyltransferase [Mycena alexandri]KAJ7023297.1 alcohol acetyltransferase [Mycena alexandri]